MARLLCAGFMLSFVTAASMAVIVLPYVAFVTYVPSVVLRGLGWMGLGRQRGRGLYTATGLLVLLLGIGLFGVFAFGYAAERLFNPIYAIVAMWAVYTLAEFASYVSLRGTSRAFPVASINIVAVVLVLLLAGSLGSLEEAVMAAEILLRPTFAIMAVSALAAAVGSLRA